MEIGIDSFAAAHNEAGNTVNGADALAQLLNA